MNLRDIKKDIEYVLGAFLEDCSVVAASNAKVADSTVAELMEEAINLYNELRDKVNVKTDNKKCHQDRRPLRKAECSRERGG